MEEVATLEGLGNTALVEEPVDVAIIATAKMQQCLENAFQNYALAKYYKEKSAELYQKYILSAWRNYVLSFQFAEACMFYVALDRNVKGNAIFSNYANILSAMGLTAEQKQALQYIEGGAAEQVDLKKLLVQLNDKWKKELDAADSLGLHGIGDLDGFFDQIGNGLKEVGGGIATAAKWVFGKVKWYWCNVDDSKYGRKFHVMCGTKVAEYYSKNKEVGKLAGQGVTVLHQKTRQYICPPKKATKPKEKDQDTDPKTKMVFVNFSQSLANVDKYQLKTFGQHFKKPLEKPSSMMPIFAAGSLAVLLWWGIRK